MMKKLLLALCCALSVTVLRAQTWTALSNLAPDYNGGVMLLLPDGTVMCKTFTGGTVGNKWDKLTPDSHGSYVNGTWSSSIATMHDDRLYFSTQVLKDGRVYVAGGEYGTGAAKGEVYDPVANTWTMAPAVASADSFYDANSEILPDGHVLQAVVIGDPLGNFNYNPTSNTYAEAASSYGIHDEVPWVKLPDGSILSLDLYSYHTGEYFKSTERYIPGSSWTLDGEVPDSLFDPFGFESGPGFLLPDGRAFFFGATGHTAYYTPSGTSSPGTWAAGPDIPGGQGMPDAAGAMMVNGKILIAVSPSPTDTNHFPAPTAFYVFDYTNNSFTLVNAPGGGTSLNQPSYQTNMLCLPDGTILYASQNNLQYYVFNPGGTPLTAGKPAINSVNANTCTSFTITGTLFNGITEGAEYGDDWQMATNYPLVRLTSGTNVYYCRTSNWNSTGVMTGSALDTATFTLPSGLPAGTYSLQVTANGNSSNNYVFTVPVPMAVSPSAGTVCVGNTFNFSDATTGGTWSSSNTSKATVGSATGIVTGVAAGTATITYALSGGCHSTATVTVNPAANAGTITGASSVCAGGTTHLSDVVTGGSWISSNSGVATVNSSGLVTGVSAGSVTISYYVFNSCGGSYAMQSLTVNPAPTAISGVNTLCVTNGAALSDDVPGGTWSSSDTSILTVSSDGIITAGASPGVATISYSTGCGTATLTVTVIATSAGTISGSTYVNVGSIITLMDTAGGGAGTWVAGNGNVTITSTGVVTGVSAGTVTIYYYVTGTCGTSVATYMLTVNSGCTGAWTTLNRAAPAPNGGVMLLLSDGTVICKTFSGLGGSGGNGTIWNKLTPDTLGSYVNGTWSTIDSMTDDRLYFSSQVLKDGRVYVAGGEYGSGKGTAEIYDPVANSWSALPAIPAPDSFSDANSEMLPDGRVLQAIVTGHPYRNYVFNPISNTFDTTGMAFGNHNEAAWTKLPDNSILATEYFNRGTNTWFTATDRYIPSLGRWKTDAPMPDTLYDVYGYEVGASFLLPNGNAFFIGASGHTAIYTPSGDTTAGSWAAGPDIPGGNGAPDAAAAMMVNGEIISAVAPTPTGVNTVYRTPTSFYVYDYVANSWTRTTAPGTPPGDTLSMQCYQTMMLDLPDGSVLYGSQNSTTYYEYTPCSGPLAEGKPTINTVYGSNCTNFIITGTLFNGISVGAVYNDDWQMNSNYPIIRLTAASGRVYYARSYNWNRTGVMTGAALDTAQFQLPAGLPQGTYSLRVIANGIASDSFMFNTNVGATISPANPTVCVGGTVTLTDAGVGGTWSSSNTDRASVASTGVVTGVSTGTAVISYTLPGGCFGTAVVSVNAVPDAGTISGTTTVCAGATTQLTDAATGGSWSSTNISMATVDGTGLVTGVSPGSVIISYTETSSCGTTAATTMIFVNATPALTINPTSASICGGGNILLSASAGSGSIMLEDFNSGFGAWTVDNSGTTNPSGVAVWLVEPNGFDDLYGRWYSPDFTAYAEVNGYSYGGSPADVSNSRLISPAFSLAGATSATLSFQQAYFASPYDYNVEVDISTDGGSSWGLLHDYKGASIGGIADYVPTFVDLGAYVGQSDLKVRFWYYTYYYGYYWALDNVQITATGDQPAVWSPILTLYNDAGLTTPYDGAGQGDVYASPAATTTYTATVTSTNGCTGFATRTVSVNAAPVLGAITGTTTVCSGNTTHLTDITTGGTWSSSNTDRATVGSTGIVTGVSPGTATITYTVTNSCGTADTTITVTVNSGTTPIFGSSPICVNTSVSFSDATAGGSWTSSNPSVASVTSTGLVNGGASPGTAVISYTTGCGTVTYAVTVIATSPGTITGPATVTVGSNISLTDAVAGGSWSASNGNATVSGGLVTGVTAGSVIISYAVTGACGTVYATKLIMVNNSSISGITGNTTICVGSTSTLTDATSGGTWSSNNTAIAAVSGTSGVVTGVSAGTTYVTYTAGGVSTTVIVTVLVSPAPINGAYSECLGATVTLSDLSSGGTWTSSNGNVFIDGSGDVTGMAVGASTITYMLSDGCFSTYPMTVYPNPAPITGITTVCVGGSTTLTDTTSGSLSWTSSNTSIATTSGDVVTGLSTGSVVITYKVTSGCYATTTVFVQAALSNSSIYAYGNITSECVGQTNIFLSDGTGTGTWSSSNASIAFVGSGTGTVTGISAGTASITYTESGAAGCFAVQVVTINASTPITGATSVCSSGTTNLTDATGGGTWSSSSTGIANVSSTGVVSGVSTGSVVISYTQSNGCIAIYNMTVNPGPTAIGGNTSICLGGTTALTDGTSGGVWTSSNTSVATVGSSSGVVTGTGTAAATITYTAGGCYTTIMVTVSANPSAILGTKTVCSGATTSLSDGTAGGSWSATGDATVGTGGLVTGGGSAGTATISYTLTSGCSATATVTVNAAPAPITGNVPTCVGATLALSDATTGGTWTSSNSGTATVGSATGIVTGVATGVVVISYSTGGSCVATVAVTVHAVPTAILGTKTVCAGATTSLSDATTGGTWSATGDGSVTPGGIVTGGGTAGTALISYTLSSGCSATAIVTVNAGPGAITGNGLLCTGATLPLSDATSGGTWSSSNASIASVGSSTGVVTGVAAGTARITYSTGGACNATIQVTVNISPNAIMGASSICAGLTATLTDASTGGAWSSSDNTIGSVSSSGVVTGIAPGSVTISYSFTSGCSATYTVNIGTGATAIGGVTSICLGGSTTLTDGTSGGVWTSSNTSVATVGSSSGVVTGTGTATATITYTAGGCSATTTVTVNAGPSAILGSLVACVGATTSLSDGTPGGAWSATGDATVGTGGLVTGGASAGTATISYTLTTGCSATATVTVNAGPTAITGNAPACVGSTLTLSDAVTGGTWSSSNTGTATVGSSTGIVTGVAGGVVVITYSTGGSCIATVPVTVNVAPAAISGPSSVCLGLTITLTDATGGGTWSSSDNTIGSVSSTGIVTGEGIGTATITYTAATGCTRTATITVGTAPSAIGGALSLCGGSTTTLTDATVGGTWSLSSSLIATIGSSTGLVTASSTYTGTTTVSYTAGGCPAIAVLTVTSRVTPIQGSSSECVGVTITLSDATAGGTWSSSNGNVTFTGTTGSPVSVTGAVAGASTITYATSPGCFTTYPNTIYANPAPITGPSTVCAGSSIFLTDATGGGVSWTSSNTAVATNVGSTVTGVSAGTANITYKITPGSCIATYTVTVNASTPVSPISGPSSVSHATPATISDATASGVWTSSNSAVISLSGSTGSPVTATALTTAGSSTISYTVTNISGCVTRATKVITAVAAPPPHGGSTTTLFAGATVNLFDETASGLWSSSDNNIATVDGYGTVTGINPGIASITHSITNDHGDVTTNVTTVEVTALPVNVSVIPNPNKGTFTVSGTMGSTQDEEVTLEVTDVLGQVIYNNKVIAQGGKLHEMITLGNTLANGMYLLNVHGTTGHKAFHFVIEQ